uniref:Exopolysaccharide production protein ExoZ n=1 Tax=Halomonas phage vB_HboP_4908 TaxID=3350578 RepID=A0AB74UQ81_9VIRU
MSGYLANYVPGRDNNFNLIRFVAATLVLFSHSFALSIGSSDAEPLRATIGMTWGDIAVDIFFITSGFLIAGSFFARSNILAFLWARALRIYPALIIAVLFCVFVIGLAFTSLEPREYLTHEQTHRYLINNITLLWGIEYSLPGVFANNPFAYAVNGSLWTMPYEVKMYILLTIIFAMIALASRATKIFSYQFITAVIGTGAVCFHIANHFEDLVTGQFLRLFAMFFVGAAFYAWRERILLSSRITALLVALLIASAFINESLFFVIYCLSLPLIIFGLAYLPSGHVRSFNKLGDYSYGLYIFAFPVQQSLAAIVPNISVFSMIALSFLVTSTLAVLSWHVVEKKCLKMKNVNIIPERFFKSLFSKP